MRLVLVFALLAALLSPRAIAQDDRAIDPNPTDAVEEIWFTGPNDIQLSIGGKVVGPLPQRIVVSYEKGPKTMDKRKIVVGKGHMRIGYSFTADDQAAAPKQDEDIGPNEANIIRKSVTGWIDGGDVFMTSPIVFTLAGAAGAPDQSVHATLRAYRLGLQFCQSRRHAIALTREKLTSHRYLDLGYLFSSPNDEPILDVVPGDTSTNTIAPPKYKLFIARGVRLLPRPASEGSLFSYTVHAYGKSVEYDFYLVRPDDTQFLEATILDVDYFKPEAMDSVYDDGPMQVFFKDHRGRLVAFMRLYRS